jgi:hypothetical protein
MPKTAADNKAPTYRERFRSKTLGTSSTRRWEAVTIDLGDGEEMTVVIKAPSLSGQELAYEEAGMEFLPGVDGKGQSRIAKPLRYSVEMVILCCFEPQFGPNGEVVGPGAPLYTAADRPALMEEAMKGWLKKLADLVSTFNDEKPKAIAKNSEPTSDASSASL